MLYYGCSDSLAGDERERTTRHVAQGCCRVGPDFLALAPVILRSVLELDQCGAGFTPDVSRSAQRAVGGFRSWCRSWCWVSFDAAVFMLRALPYSLVLRPVWGTGSSARTTPGTSGTADFYFVVRVAGERHAFGHGRCRRVLGVRCARSDERHVLRAESVGAHTIDDACGDG